MTLPEPPPYTLELYQLRPTTLNHDARYDCHEMSTYQSMLLYPGSNSERKAVPAPWVEYINPEGLPYFYDPTRRIVTEADVRSRSMLAMINNAANSILAKCADVNEPGYDKTELYLQIDENGQLCRYYLVDHKKQTQFWLEEVDSSDLGLPPSASRQTLAHHLAAQYWTHVEWFGGHIELSEDIFQETIAILKFGLVDVKTSTESPFPYSATETEGFLQVLDGFTDGPMVRGYRNWVTARIRETIATNRAINLYGERNARLSSSQTRVFDMKSKSPVPSWIFSVFFFNKPIHLHGKLRDLWIDKITFTRSWQAFAQETTAGLRDNIIQDLILSLSSVASLAVPFTTGPPALHHVTIALNTTSVILAVASAGFALGLRATYSELSQAASTEAGSYQDQAYHKKYGFYPLAVKLSVPSVLFRWALVLFAIASTATLLNVLYAAWDDTVWSYVLFLPAFAVAALILSALLKALFRSVRAIRRRLFTSIALPLHTSDIGV